MQLQQSIDSNLSHLRERLSAGRIFSFREKNFLLIQQSSAVYLVSDDYIRNPGGDSILRQMEILSDHGYLCKPAEKCNTLPQQRLQTLVLNVCHACNLTCDYCSVGQGTYNAPIAYMDTGIAKAAIDYLVENIDGDEAKIRFFGGEPLLNFSVMKETITYSKEQYPGITFKYYMTTNGTLITDKIADFLALNFSEVCVSLDGIKEEHDRHRVDRGQNGSWERAVEGIRRLEAKDVPHIINCVVCKDSSHTLKYYEDKLSVMFPRAKIAVGYEYSYTKEKGGILKDWFGGIHDRSLEMIDLKGTPINRVLGCILDSPFSHNLDCPFGITSLAITPKGEIYLCADSMMLKDGEFMYSRLGNITGGFDFSKTMVKKCRECWALNLCGKGCHMRKTMGIDPEEEYCSLQQGFIKDAIEYISNNDLDILYEEFKPEVAPEVKMLHKVITGACPDIMPLFLNPCRNCASKI